MNLVDWFKGMVANRRGEELLDPLMETHPSPRALKRVLLVCLRCIDSDANKRPKMGQIVHMLESEEFSYRAVSFPPLVLSHKSGRFLLFFPLILKKKNLIKQFKLWFCILHTFRNLGQPMKQLLSLLIQLVGQELECHPRKWHTKMNKIPGGDDFHW